MATAALIQRAKAGDVDAIATLLTQALAPAGVSVAAERRAYCLELELEGQPLPDQTAVVTTIRQGIERLEIDGLGVVQIHCLLTGHPDIGWEAAISLLGADLNGNPSESSPSPFPPTHPSPSKPAPTRQDPVSQSTLEQAYGTLALPPDATLEDAEKAYFRLRAALLRQGQRDAIAELKAAHALVKHQLQQEHRAPRPSAAIVEEDCYGIEPFVEQLRSRGLNSQARLNHGTLQIRLEPDAAQHPSRATATIYTLLEQTDLTALGLDSSSRVEVYGMASPQKIGWKRLIPLPPPETTDDTDVLSFKNRYASAIAFPVLLLLGMVMNALPLVNVLLFGVKIWFHEFGHAIVAWLAGRRALPLPIGWANIGEHRSLFVYLGLLTLFTLLFWTGRREGHHWPMVLAVVLGVIQFWFTWLMPVQQYETLLSFGGIGGEFYLCTLLMVSFFFPMPAYWRWDFYRYPVVLGAAFTFWGQFWLWRQINRGVASIPWGSMWGGEAYGDMNNLRYAGWSDQQIIGTYTTLGNVCLLVLITVYLYVAIRQNRHYLFALTQRWLARP